MNLNTFGGFIKGGNYDILITHGNAVLQENAKFDTLVVKGILQTSTCQGRRIVIDGGMLNASGEIIADSLSGHGSVCARQRICARNIVFIGKMKTSMQITVKETIQVNGTIDAKSLTSSTAKLIGHTDIKECTETGRLETVPIRTAMFERFGMDEYLGPSNIKRIVATNVALCDTICQKIDAGYVTLSGHAHVEKVIYDGDLRLDKTSSATLIEHRWAEDEDGRLQRKVA
ncbi:hypothetical protein OZX74_05130 [Bifidobacterium sp. ESL0798]|uniref:hypothetical protein n=1 Tax=Bifidobacterium sp. ESL0798 TaxID=2983235 RepID=UPI0023F7A216|nr:hypothetical protein [Bifidobacterium sp. ESL0798]WEV73337.1 hypothetical protein OZX74_05130 [Bifidobacterium sp. ESL0798]